MPYLHRSRARPELDLVVDAPALVDNSADNTITPVIPGSTTSRFHITARVRIADRSLYVSPGWFPFCDISTEFDAIGTDRRVELSIPPSHTHRWMISVTAPSYSIPLASFMTRLTLLAVTPSDSTQRQPCTVDKVPFAIIGSSSESFLAKVIMEWVSGGRMEVEHWIDLDPGNSASSVLGSEQVLDVELDKGTRLLTVPSGHLAPMPSLEREPADITRQSVMKHPEAADEFGYEKVLRSLLPRVPMTMKDMKLRASIQVPYKLVSSPAHLLALVPGRRKAIEWGRARALQALYVQHAASVSAKLISLTIGDVYAFLEDSGLFPRSSSKTEVPLPGGKDRKEKEQESTPLPIDEPCIVCGIKKRLHPALALTTRVKKEPALDEATAWVCDIVPLQELERGLRVPTIDLTKTFGGGFENALYAEASPDEKQVLPHQPTASSQALTAWRHTPRQVILLSPPDLTLAIHKSVDSLRLSHFPELPSLYLQNYISNSEIEEALAPSALLAAVLKPLISILVRSAVDVARRDITITSGSGNGGGVAGQGKLSRTKRGKKVGCILTPGHVLRGLSLPAHAAAGGMSSAPGGGGLVTTTLKDVLGLCLTRLGVPLEFGRSLTHVSLCRTEDCDGNVGMMETGGTVKLESP
ncbi:hypothetical protein AZE42_04029 [Rhizopogon vesiculosus]|uniref:YEATS domain-containing protein n=1 Tax=Rhizopogon vesiculosus TaxID=180088 RepID=A0A1J8QQT2_9AGAM|nr:hypothetical protein AZE42_04029 [Rhizopogon vesiculosus]